MEQIFREKRAAIHFVFRSRQNKLLYLSRIYRANVGIDYEQINRDTKMRVGSNLLFLLLLLIPPDCARIDPHFAHLKPDIFGHRGHTQ